MRFFVPGTGERGECDETKDKRYDKREAGRYHRFLCPSSHAGKRIPAAIYRDGQCHCRGGRGVGVEALAALGTSDWLSFTAMGGITGVAQGFSVLIAQCFGAKMKNA